MLQFKTLGIIGIGHIGREIARLGKAFHMRVIAVRRSSKNTGIRYVDQVLNRNQMPELLSQSDFVVLSLPATPESIRMIGEKELRSMKPSAYLINIARGTVIDEDALIKALQEGWIAGAGLDVYTTEPLPASSQLWELPNVIINPHVGGFIDTYSAQATQLFCDNLQRYLNGKKLLNIVDKKKCY
jgi:phosphoglycerate dehydrogenase-like enzyme